MYAQNAIGLLIHIISLCALSWQKDSVLKATACAIAQFHAVPVPDTLQGSKPQVWAKIDQWMDVVERNFPDEKMTERSVASYITSTST